MTIFETAKQILPVSTLAADEYNQKEGIIQNDVNQELAKLNSIYDFMGNCSLQVMVDHHRHHTLFMSSVFRLNNYTLLARMLVWMYRSYHAHGFSYDYFTYAFSEWRKAVTRHMSQTKGLEIDRVYQWIVAYHPDFIQLAESADYKILTKNRVEEVVNTFVAHLLHGEYQACLAISEKYYLTDVDDLAYFYVEIIEPSLYEVGRLWEMGHISVAQEHLATAMVNRLLLTIFLHTGLGEATKPKVVIAAAPNELHEIGASMVTDLLEQHGWQVDYLGANMPKEDLLEYLRANKPYFLGLSVVMPFNLASVREIIDSIRNDDSIWGIKIMVGGAAFKYSEDLWHQVGADAYVIDGHAAIKIAGRWLEENQGR
ncbi:MAG: cobalamin B12-binding domain protein [Firmicutes bacterium]|nr:cobalamin B12-binding domain protein [Bacillota bacterium]